MGQLATAGLDVFPDEPNINPKLRNMEHITILPHMGTETRDTQKKVCIKSHSTDSSEQAAS